MSGSKTVLIVYAHHIKTSFNAAMLETALKTLQEQGCNVLVSDLYQMKFNPLIGEHDIKEKVNGHFNYLAEGEKAFNTKQLSDDIVAEHNKLKQADLVIFQFPMQWFSVPAILKGWFDRVLTPGFAYSFSTFSIYENGLMKGKKAVLSFTTGSPASFFSPEGVHGDLNVVLHPLQRGALQFCGFDVLKANHCDAMIYTDDTMRKQYLQTWKTRLGKIWDEESAIPFVPVSEFDFTKGGILKEDSLHKNVDSAPSVGTHLGKPIKS